jgi:membrane protein implicated in regulation of membrane protease activity
MYWLVWLVAGILLIVAEIFTPGFVLACFSLGCFAAAVTAALDFNLTVQLIVFSATTFIVFLSIRPFAAKFRTQREQATRTNVERLVGLPAIVLEEISAWQGEAKLEGEVWTSRSENGEVFPPGAKVRVLRVEGNKLIVGPKGSHF